MKSEFEMTQQPSKLGSTSFAVVVPTVYGQMIVNRYDINQTNSLFKTGMAIDHDEIVLLARLLGECPPNPVVIDVGANFGTYSLALAAACLPRGAVHAFEPQRIVFNMLAGSVALNSLIHVHCHYAAVGDYEGFIEVPQFDYAKPMNFGSVEFGRIQQEPLSQERTHDPARIEYVPLTTLDRFGWERADLIKIDVEGMEMSVLNGALGTIARCRPILFVEFVKSDVEAIFETITSLDYRLFLTDMNFLCVPTEASSLIATVAKICPPAQVRPPLGIVLGS